MNKVFTILSIAAIFMIISSLAFGHSSWIRLEKADKSGQTISVKISHGHTFPGGDENLLPEFLKVYSIDNNGKQSPFILDKSGDGLSGSYKIRGQDVYRFCFTYLKGVMSKTTKGWKQGGKDLYPDAIQRMRPVMTGNGIFKTSGAELKKTVPFGLPLELVLEGVGKEITLKLYKDSKPYPGADILLQLPGKDEKLVGKTDAKGEIKIILPTEKGEILIVAEFKIENPAGSEVNWENYVTSLYLNLE